jgi:hypothetical protein
MKIGRVILSLDESYYAPIGEILSKWAALEYTMQVIVWKAIGLENPEGRVLTVGMSGKTPCGIVGNLTRKVILDQDAIKSIKKLTRFMNKNVDFRNRLSHGIEVAPQI